MINNVVIQGNLTHDPELKATPNGVSYARFNVAINKKTAQQEITYYIPVVAWRQSAEFLNRYFKRGQQIAVEGELTQRTYTDNDGNKRNVVEVVARQLHFCGNKGSNAPQQAAAPAQISNGSNNNNGAGYADLSGYEEILSDGDVPF